MNIPSLEAILTDLDEARRQRNASNRRIEELTDALETQQRVIKQAHEDIAKLTAERDEWEANSGQWEQEYYKASAERDAAMALQQEANRILIDQSRSNEVLKSALREAKEALEICLAEIKKWRDDYEYDDFNSPFVNSAIANINKVLGEE